LENSRFIGIYRTYTFWSLSLKRKLTTTNVKYNALFEATIRSVPWNSQELLEEAKLRVVVKGCR
jgi:hypothetical protein